MRDTAARDFLYENPPLVEVIAEIHWRLVPIQIGPGTAIDPHREAFAEAFTEACAQYGFTVDETVVPDNVPRELLGHQVVRRFRREANGWPLFQIGPGVVTANIVPPYDGWSEFLPVIRLAVQMLFRSYPLPERYLKIEALELRYIDAFTEKHGVTDRATFIRDDLGMAPPLPEAVLALASETEEPVQQTASALLQLRNPANSTASLSVENGTASDRPAVIATFRARTRGDHLRGVGQDFIETWFNDAHGVVKEWFESVVSGRVKEKMGPARELQG
jgi:uncharacterized protein (TIGR04255 family)